MKIDSSLPVFDAVSVLPRRVAENQAQHRELIQAANSINHSDLLGYSNELTFALDPDTHRPVMRIVDRKTQELVQQIPAEQVLRMAEDLRRMTRERGA
ncbi:MAG: flagellar protein FlaG [Acidobacteria bacterium]|nr:flagellar protein FlaG [Acidobacteriota bacterium]MBI3470563.1 flagellar protein FlaG [Candidatus Solibacter usitatus]